MKCFIGLAGISALVVLLIGNSAYGSLSNFPNSPQERLYGGLPTFTNIASKVAQSNFSPLPGLSTAPLWPLLSALCPILEILADIEDQITQPATDVSSLIQIKVIMEAFFADFCEYVRYLLGTRPGYACSIDELGNFTSLCTIMSAHNIAADIKSLFETDLYNFTASTALEKTWINWQYSVASQSVADYLLPAMHLYSDYSNCLFRSGPNIASSISCQIGD